MLFACCLLHAGFLLALLFDPEWTRHVPPKRLLIFNGPHGVMFQNIELFLLQKLTEERRHYTIPPLLPYVTLLSHGISQ
jgi:hypothetical protein